ncbi:hypothetical protein ANN_24348 [Periplaneta americana]|uniref:Uncharacterized protein n=1 Tax=Periplaneta americana TaxID=6978 RepID=A0ABQ8S363_PERAM|nr:hypothetical protein ANN_24348 [Periplaneta americana]
MAGLCEGGNEPSGSLKAISSERYEGVNAGEMSLGSSTESYPAFAHIGLRVNPGKNLNQVTCPNRKSNLGHLVSRPDALTVTPRVERIPNLTGEQSDGITVFRIPPMTSLMLHRCRTGVIKLQRWWRSPSAAITDFRALFTPEHDRLVFSVHKRVTLDTQGILLLQEKLTESQARESNPGPHDLEASMLTNRSRRQSLDMFVVLTTCTLRLLNLEWLKDIVYQVKVQTREELLQCILDAAATIRNKRVKMRNATRAVHTRAKSCLEIRGGIFPKI